MPVCNNTEAALALFQDVTGARTKTGKDRKVWFMFKQTVSRYYPMMENVFRLVCVKHIKVHMHKSGSQTSLTSFWFGADIFGKLHRFIHLTQGPVTFNYIHITRHGIALALRSKYYFDTVTKSMLNFWVSIVS